MDSAHHHFSPKVGIAMTAPRLFLLSSPMIVAQHKILPFNMQKMDEV